MYRTNRACRPAGALAGPLVVSMRPVPADQVATAVRVTSRYPAVHGAPSTSGRRGSRASTIRTRRTSAAGSRSLPARSRSSGRECVTPQAAVTHLRPSFAIGQAPGHMAITDARDSGFQVP